MHHALASVRPPALRQDDLALGIECAAIELAENMGQELAHSRQPADVLQRMRLAVGVVLRFEFAYQPAALAHDCEHSTLG